jgi:UDP-N-acetylmuramate--alanine ligase
MLNLSKSQNREFHFIGCGGAGMFPLAIIMIEKGYKVSGSDLKESKNTKKLKELGAKVYIGHSEDNLPQTNDAIIIFSSAVSEENPEMQKAKELNLITFRRGAFLAEIASLYKTVIAISGSHGKTTVTSMLAYLLSHITKDVAYIVGGTSSAFELPAAAGDGDIFITEVDESDGSHTYMHPKIGVITNVECDHAWSVGGEEALMNNFTTFAFNSKNIIYHNTNRTNKLFNQHPSKIVIDKVEPYTFFKTIPQSTLNTWADYQIENLAIVLKVSDMLGINRVDAEKAILSFPGVDRRMTLHFNTKEFILIEDYAHHPTEVSGAIQALNRRYPNHKLYIIFQPHRYARLERYLSRFAKELSEAEGIFITPVFAAWVEKGKIDSSSLQELIGDKANVISDNWEREASQILDRIPRENTVLAVFGAGSVNKIIPPLLEGIKQK